MFLKSHGALRIKREDSLFIFVVCTLYGKQGRSENKEREGEGSRMRERNRIGSYRVREHRIMRVKV